MKQIIRTRLRWADFKLRTKLLVSYLFIILFTVILIGSFSYSIAFNSTNKLTNEYSEEWIGQIGVNMERRMKDIEDYVFNQFKQSGIRQFIGETQELNDQGRLVLTLTDFLYSRQYIKFVLIKSLSGEIQYVQADGINFANADYRTIGQNSKARDKYGQTDWAAGDKGLLILSRSLYEIESYEYYGELIVGIQDSYLKELYEKLNVPQLGKIFMLNDRNEILSARTEFTDELLEKLSAADDAGQLMTKTEMTLGGQRYLVTSKVFSDRKWKIVHTIPRTEIDKPIQSLRNRAYLAGLVAAVLAIFLSIWISKQITDNLSNLLRSINNISHGMFGKVNIPVSKDEIGQLSNRFNMMSDRIVDLINVASTEKVLKEKAEYHALQHEFMALQAQMNPHFLFNTLESIQSMALIRKEPVVAEMVRLLGAVLRDSLRQRNDFIRLEEELEYIRNILKIHERSHGDRLSVHYGIDESLLSCMVPKFILQPLVENAIMHGIENIPGRGLVMVQAYVADNALCLKVTDNGHGIEAELIARLLNGTGENRSGKSARIGVYSVVKRLAILFGEPYGAKIAGKVGEGTTVTVTMPIIQESELDRYEYKSRID